MGMLLERVGDITEEMAFSRLRVLYMERTADVLKCRKSYVNKKVCSFLFHMERPLSFQECRLARPLLQLCVSPLSTNLPHDLSSP